VVLGWSNVEWVLAKPLVFNAPPLLIETYDPEVADSSPAPATKAKGTASIRC